LNSNLALLEWQIKPVIICDFSYPLNIPSRKHHQSHLSRVVRAASKQAKVCVSFRAVSDTQRRFGPSVHFHAPIVIDGHHNDLSEAESIQHFADCLSREWERLCRHLSPGKELSREGGEPAVVRLKDKYIEDYKRRNEVDYDDDLVLGCRLNYSLFGHLDDLLNLKTHTAFSNRTCIKKNCCAKIDSEETAPELVIS